MKKTLYKLIGVWNFSSKTIVILLLSFFLILFGLFLFSQPRLSGDVASHLMLAISPILEIGSPYKDIWEIKPPVWPLVMFIWSNIFGFSLLSIKIASIAIMSLTALLVHQIYKRVFQSPVLEIIFISSIAILFSPLLNSIIMPTEMMGLFFSLAALLIIIKSKNNFSKYYFSGFLFFAASQTKEPFTFTALAVIPILINSLLVGGFKRFVKDVGNFLFGMVTCLAVIVTYLSVFGSLQGYLEVYKFKQDFFPLDLERLFRNFSPALQSAERTFVELYRGILIVSILSVVSFLFVNKFKKILSFDKKKSQLMFEPIVISDEKKNIKYAVLFYAVGSFLGFGLGGVFGSHYLIQVVIPFYIILGIFSSYLFANTKFLFGKSKIYFGLSLVVLILSLAVTIPKRQYLTSYLPKTNNFYTKDQVYGFEKRIAEITSKDQCILSVYGWGVSENYLYSKRKPCTRFFLPNIVHQDWQKIEYKKSIVNNPPAVIAYQTKLSDMDISRFEKEVINISKIIENCYSQDSQESVLFISKFSDVNKLQKCVSDNSTQ